MKKKILAFALILSALVGQTAFAATVSAPVRSTRAVLMCYDESGALVYSNLYKSDDGNVTLDIPEEYEGMRKRVYFVDTNEFMDIDDTFAPEPSGAPEATVAPETTAKPEASGAPEATAKPDTAASPYEREVDGIYATALVKDVVTSVNSDNEDIYAVTLFYQGSEITVGIDADLKIASAPDEYSYMKGENAGALEKGDAICLTANIAGDEIRTVDFIFRPTEEDIVTGNADYGESFERLAASDGKVAGKWSYIRYGEKSPSDKYTYAFGVVAKKNGSALTLVNKSGSEDSAVEIDIADGAYVYICDVDGKEYEVEIASVSDIETTIPKSAFNNDASAAELTADYAYNYALVRLVNGDATDIIIYSNYNN